MRTRAASRRIDPASLESVAVAFHADLAARWYSEAAKKQARHVLARFFEHLGKQRVRDVRSVTEAHVFAYARQLAQQKIPTGHYAFATQRSYLQVVQRLFRFLTRAGVILQDPTLDLVLPHWTKLPRAVLNQAQARRLVARPSPLTHRGKRDIAVLELLYGTGIRVGECERLDLKDVDLAQGTLMVRTGKGKKDRVVPLAGRAAAALEVYVRDARLELVKDPKQHALFITSWGRRLGVSRIQDLVRMNAKEAGIDLRVTPHTLRHGCATHLLQGGADIRHVQKLLGHSQLQTTAIYVKVAPQDLARAVKKAHPRERTWRRRNSRKGGKRG